MLKMDNQDARTHRVRQEVVEFFDSPIGETFRSVLERQHIALVSQGPGAYLADSAEEIAALVRGTVVEASVFQWLLGIWDNPEENELVEEIVSGQIKRRLN